MTIKQFNIKVAIGYWLKRLHIIRGMYIGWTEKRKFYCDYKRKLEKIK
jgi:hypothetical protein